LWLDKEVADITVPATNGKTDLHHLQSATLRVPEVLLAEVFVSGPCPPVQIFIRILQRHNAGLHTDRWLLRRLEQTDHSMLAVWNIDKESADALEAVDNRPHFWSDRVTFKVSRRPNPASPLKPQIGRPNPASPLRPQIGLPIPTVTDLTHKRSYRQQQEV